MENYFNILLCYFIDRKLQKPGFCILFQDNRAAKIEDNAYFIHLVDAFIHNII